MLASATLLEKPTTAEGIPNALLYRGIKSILRCDDAEVVHGIARYVVSQRLNLRVLSALLERTAKTPFPTAVALYGGLKSFLSVRRPRLIDGAVWIARLNNERQAITAKIDAMASPAVELPWTESEFHLLPNLEGTFKLLKHSLAALRRLPKLIRLLRRRYEFFKVLRVVELIAFYTRYLEIFEHARFRLAVTSNHSNPHGIAFNLAARKCDVPIVLISHGMPVRPVARLTYDLAVVHCEAARQTYLEEGCQLRHVLVHGRRQDYEPMQAGPLPARFSLGVFLCKDVNEARLMSLVETLLAQPRVARVLIRPHPTNLWAGINDWTALRNDARLKLSTGREVSQDLEECDGVLAGNSSVLVEAVTAGLPSAYVPQLDFGLRDMHAFVAKGLIYCLEGGFNPEAMLAFYQRPCWLKSLRLFANIDEDDSEVTTRFLSALCKLAAFISQKSHH
jgi:hypothetical protein